jgi:hypothetical protein
LIAKEKESGLLPEEKVELDDLAHSIPSPQPI